MNKIVLYIALLLGGAAFLGMLKLMYDMTGHMARMTDQVAVMSTGMEQMGSLSAGSEGMQWAESSCEVAALAVRFGTIS